MEKRFTLKDFLLFAAIGAVLVTLLVAMYMIDRQWNMMARMRATMQEQAEDLRALRSDLKALDQRVESGALAAARRRPRANLSGRRSPAPATLPHSRSRGRAGLRAGRRRNPPRRLRPRRLAGAGLRGGTVDHHPAHLPGRLRLERAELRAGEPALARPRHAGMGGAHRALVGDRRGRTHHRLPAARRGDVLRRPAAHRRRRRVHLRLHHERGHRGAARPRLPGEDRIGRGDLSARRRLPVPGALLQRAGARRRHGGDAAPLLRALPRRARHLQRVEGPAARLRTLSPRRPEVLDPGPRHRGAGAQPPLLGTGRRRASTASCGRSSRTTARGSPPSATATSTPTPRARGSTRGCSTTRRSGSRPGTSSS